MRATHNIGDLNAALAEYQRVRRLTNAEVLSREAGQLGREIFFQLLAIAPAKGSIRDEVLGRLKTGRFIKIRQSVREKNELKMLRHYVKRFGYRPGRRKFRGKKLNYQNELIKREIGVRESGRRVLAISIRYPKRLPENAKSVSRYGQMLSAAAIRTNSAGGFAKFDWSSRSEQGQSVTGGIGRARARGAIEKAIAIRTKDLITYTRRKHVEAATKAVRKMIRPRFSQADATAEIRRVMAGGVN